MIAPAAGKHRDASSVEEYGDYDDDDDVDDEGGDQLELTDKLALLEGRAARSQLRQRTGSGLVSKSDDEDGELSEGSIGPVDDRHDERERECFSDPDFHDERPGKRAQSEQSNSGEVQLICETESSEEETVFAVDGVGDHDENRSAVGSESASGSGTIQSESRESVGSDDKCDGVEIEPAPEEELNQVTASEADFFADDATLADECLSSLTKDVPGGYDEEDEEGDDDDDDDEEEVEKEEEEFEEDQSDEIETDEQVGELEREAPERNQLEAAEAGGQVGRMETDETNELRGLEIDSEPSQDEETKKCELGAREKMLVDMISDYCDKLVELIKEEALRQVELIISGDVERIQMEHSLEATTSLAGAGLQTDVDIRSKKRQIYTSSLYYDDKLGSFPTIEQQVERCRMIAKTLESCPEEAAERDQKLKTSSSSSAPAPTSHIEEKASQMFKQRRERMDRFTIPADNEERARDLATSARRRSMFAESLASRPGGESMAADEPSSAVTDTEYEAPKVRIRRSLTNPIVSGSNEGPKFEPHYRPFLDSSTLKNIERLRQWSPRQDFNEHASVSPEVCFKLVADLNGDQSNNKGVKLFEQRQLQSFEWVVGEARASDEKRPEPASRQAEGETGSKTQASDRMDTKSSPAGRWSQASVGEGLIEMVAAESSEEQVKELAPLVMDHTAPQLELATVTRTPSFGTSSRFVIECDSPDLLTSHDDELEAPSESSSSTAASNDLDQKQSLEVSSLMNVGAENEDEDENEQGIFLKVPEMSSPGAFWRSPNRLPVLDESPLDEGQPPVKSFAGPQSRSVHVYQSHLVELRPNYVRWQNLEQPIGEEQVEVGPLKAAQQARRGQAAQQVEAPHEQLGRQPRQGSYSWSSALAHEDKYPHQTSPSRLGARLGARAQPRPKAGGDGSSIRQSGDEFLARDPPRCQCKCTCRWSPGAELEPLEGLRGPVPPPRRPTDGERRVTFDIDSEVEPRRELRATRSSSMADRMRSELFQKSESNLSWADESWPPNQFDESPTIYRSSSVDSNWSRPDEGPQSTGRGRICSLRVHIKLPKEEHKIIIERRPEVVCARPVSGGLSKS